MSSSGVGGSGGSQDAAAGVVTGECEYDISKLQYPNNLLCEFGRGSYLTEGELKLLRGVTAYIDPLGSTYVYTCDQGNTITKFNASIVIPPEIEGDIEQVSKAKFVKRWEALGCTGIEADKNGNIYVAGNAKITVYDSDGNWIREWGSNGSGDGKFNDIWDVAVNDTLGLVYVADSKNFRVQVFDLNKDVLDPNFFVRKWGSEGTGDGEFSGPRGPYGIAVDENTGDVYVADTEAHRIQKFDQDGNFLGKWGKTGNCRGFIKFPRDIAVDSKGRVYNTDTDAERIQVFNSDGSYYGEFQGLHNPTDGPFHPRSVAIAQNDYIYAAAAYSKRIDEFGPIDNYTIAGFSPEDTDPDDPDGYCSQNEFCYSNPLPGENRCHPADGRGNEGQGSENYLASFGWIEHGKGVLYGPRDITIDYLDNIYVADTSNFLVQKFDKNGNYLGQFGYSGRVWTMYTGANDYGNFDFPSTLTVDSVGNVYVIRPGSDYGGDPTIKRIQRFNKDGRFLGAWNYDQFHEGMLGIAYNSYNDYTYVSNTRKNKIQYLDRDGKYQGEFQFNSPGRITADNDGYIYVVDYINNSIEKFTADGTFVTKWGGRGSQQDQFMFDRFSGIYVDNWRRHIYVADTFNRRIQVFDLYGTFISMLIAGDWNERKFTTPMGVVVDSDGFIYVLDSTEQTVKKFSPISIQ